MPQLRMNTEEWRKVIEALDHTPKAEQDPHWQRARSALHAFVAPIVEFRQKHGDPRRDIVDVACGLCPVAVTPGHNYVFEPSTGSSFHAKCWLKRRLEEAAAKKEA